ncbi:transposase [Nonomuraea thailandensis]
MRALSPYHSALGPGRLGGYGYCRSHSRWFWGLRLHLICTPAGLPITWALATPNIDERQVLMAICEHDPHLLADRPGLLIIADKGYVSAELDAFLAERGVRLLRPSYRNRTPRPGEHLLKPIRQLIESVNDTLKDSVGRFSGQAARARTSLAKWLVRVAPRGWPAHQALRRTRLRAVAVNRCPR